MGEILSAPEKQKEAWWHPHSTDERTSGTANVIFKASERLSLDITKPGAGLLPFDKKRVLTMEGATKATWAMNEVYDTQHIYGKRKNGAKDPIKGLYYAGIWQELAIEARGSRFDAFLNDKNLFTATDTTFTAPGRVALSTKADSVTYFDDLLVRSLT